MKELIPGWVADGPHFKNADQYLSRDGKNPEAPWPGYGWPLGTECWFYQIDGHGYSLCATGKTKESAWNRAIELARSKSPSTIPS